MNRHYLITPTWLDTTLEFFFISRIVRATKTGTTNSFAKLRYVMNLWWRIYATQPKEKGTWRS